MTLTRRCFDELLEGSITCTGDITSPLAAVPQIFAGPLCTAKYLPTLRLLMANAARVSCTFRNLDQEHGALCVIQYIKCDS